MSQHNEVVDRQFGEQADAYLTSQVHASGEEFAAMVELLKARGAGRVLDLGSGAGHVSFQVSPYASEVVAYDLSQSMLSVVEESAKERGLVNISTVEGVAESLPFEASSFDYVISRYSAHHWQDVGAALREVRRVLKRGGLLIIVDVIASGNPLFDSYLQAVEILRDTSHVRDYSAHEWYKIVGESGLTVNQSHRQRLRLEFSSWVERMRTPLHYQRAIRALQQDVAQSVRDYFEIDAEGSFTTDVLYLSAENL